MQYYATDNITNSFDHVDGAIINILSANKPWYSPEFGDLVKNGEKVPWGHADIASADTFITDRTLGLKWYEMTDHTSNVVAVVMDRKSGHINPSDTFPAIRSVPKK